MASKQDLYQMMAVKQPSGDVVGLRFGQLDCLIRGSITCGTERVADRLVEI